MQLNFDAVRSAAQTVPEWAVMYWPGPVGRRLRRAYWGKRLGAMGSGCVIDVGVVIQSPEHVFLGDNVWVDNYVQLIAGVPPRHPRITVKENPAYRGRPGELHIGSNTHIAPFCVLQGRGGLSIGSDSGVAAHAMLYSLSNHYRDGKDAGSGEDYDQVIKFSPMVPLEKQALISAPVVTENATAVGLGAILLPGSIVRQYSWVGSGAVVMGEIPGGVIAGGNPARVLKSRFGGAPPHD
jgi:acetyltransferase-like isoleucine patch superfamily enzyme